ncbi:MAG: S41 family peptidase [Chitinophagales bacterium]|nr:S41 family peptidase [Chitinophagales bacterium]
MKKLFTKTKLAILLLVVFIFGIAASSTTEYFEISKNLEIFATLYKELNSYYVDDIEPNEFMREGIDAMLKSLDPYTNFYSEAEIEDYRFQTTGKYGGIGSLIKNDGNYIVITEPYKDYPADKAGLKAGDKIETIDGINVKGKNSEEVSKLLKGEPGTAISVEVLRPQVDGSTKKMTFEIKREEVKVNNVPYYGMASDDVGYIKLSNFTQNAGKEVQDALKALEEKTPNLKGVILDVRGNPGGLLHEAVNIVNVFVPKGQLVVTTKGKIKEWEKEFNTLNSATDTEIPLVVLTSRSSASASEIVSGSVQDLDRGVIIGQKTFGKGLVQTTRKLEYNTQLKVTTAKYYIPSGRCIQAINYAERDENGAVSKIPDSLKVAFKTHNGRTVYDGGGVDPDITTEVKPLTDITVSLLRKDLMFEYATLYKLKNAELRDGEDFRLSDTEYQDFVNWLQDKEYDYVTDSEELLKEFKETAEKEDYFDGVQDEFEALKTKVAHDKEKDLQKQKNEIRRFLEEEIVTRYFYREGAIKNGFVYDKEIKKALETLNDSKAYNDLLQAKQ